MHAPAQGANGADMTNHGACICLLVQVGIVCDHTSGSVGGVKPKAELRGSALVRSVSRSNLCGRLS